MGKRDRAEEEALNQGAFSRELLLWVPGAQSLHGTGGDSPHTWELSSLKGKGAGIFALDWGLLPGGISCPAFPAHSLSRPSLRPEPQSKHRAHRRLPAAWRGEAWRLGGVGDNNGIFARALPQVGLELRGPDHGQDSWHWGLDIFRHCAQTHSRWSSEESEDVESTREIVPRFEKQPNWRAKHRCVSERTHMISWVSASACVDDIVLRAERWVCEVLLWRAAPEGKELCVLFCFGFERLSLEQCLREILNRDLLTERQDSVLVKSWGPFGWAV